MSLTTIWDIQLGTLGFEVFRKSKIDRYRTIFSEFLCGKFEMISILYIKKKKIIFSFFQFDFFSKKIILQILILNEKVKNLLQILVFLRH